MRALGDTHANAADSVRCGHPDMTLSRQRY
jgi:hypothetical protein